MKLKFKDFIELFTIGNPVHFMYSVEDIVIRFDGNNGYSVKRRGELPYKITSNNDLVKKALLECTQITEEEFNKF